MNVEQSKQALYQRLGEAVMSLTDGGRFDLTDSPKSMLSQIVELTNQVRTEVARLESVC